ncbi:hypothetical protein Y1Q_0011009 [Alligator mississippiensis]|uniref:Ig-like domain-containing protein n=1 Tax=Alligator mississippiensis TaxID=8496 RepID=A0A151LYA4_ALLMI|nr:hypothetical protein Y1Q_0011009 [Alligator mississippiensis]
MSVPCNYCLSFKAEQKYPKPFISVIPSQVVFLGGEITILCEGLHHDVKFYLYKDGSTPWSQQEVRGRNMSEFPITNMNQEDGGSYTCDYHPITAKNHWSHLSDPVELVVRGEGPSSTSPVSASPLARSSAGLHAED